MANHIVLETTQAAPSGRCVISIESRGEAPGISLSVGEGGKFDDKDNWVTDPAIGKQSISFLGDKGPVTLTANIPASDAVAIAAAHKVVVLVMLRTALRNVREAGAVSGAYTVLDLVRVVEVWDRPGVKRWEAKDWAAKASEAAKSLDPATGKIKAA